jgi:hypothetical protein
VARDRIAVPVVCALLRAPVLLLLPLPPIGLGLGSGSGVRETALRLCVCATVGVQYMLFIVYRIRNTNDGYRMQWLIPTGEYRISTVLRAYTYMGVQLYFVYY